MTKNIRGIFRPGVEYRAQMAIVILALFTPIKAHCLMAMGSGSPVDAAAAAVRSNCGPGGPMADIPDCPKIIRDKIEKSKTSPTASTEAPSTAPKNKPTDMPPDNKNPKHETQRETVDAAEVKANQAKAQKFDEQLLAQERARNARNLEIQAAKQAKARQEARARLLPSQSEQEKSAFRHDQPIALGAINAVNAKERFPFEKGRQAKDKELRNDLLSISLAQDAKGKYHEASTAIGEQISELAAMAAKLAATSAALKEVSASKSSSGKMVASTISTSNEVQSPAESDNKSGIGQLPSIVESEETTTDKNGTAVEKSNASNKIKDLSLKNKLVVKLRAADAAEKKLAAGNSDSAVNENGKRENAAVKVMSEVLDPALEANADYNRSDGGKGSSFSLSNSETDAEVKRMTDEADRQLTSSAQAADDIKAGILELESPSLFERVKARITGCLRQHCVISKSIAQK